MADSNNPGQFGDRKNTEKQAKKGSRASEDKDMQRSGPASAEKVGARSGSEENSGNMGDG